MRKLKLTEQQLDNIIAETVNKYLKESVDDNEYKDHVSLLREYIKTAAKRLEMVQSVLNHPDVNFMLQDDDNAFHMAKAVLENAHELYNYIKSEIKTEPRKKYEYKSDDFSEPVSADRKQMSMNEQKESPNHNK